MKSYKKLYKTISPFFIGILIILGPILFLIIRAGLTKVHAAWFDEKWTYRQIITFNNAGAEVSNQKVKIQFDTTTQINAHKMQGTCQDVRFTDNNAKPLKYYVNVSGGAGVGCPDSSTDFYVLMPTITTGQNIIYIYYGNQFAQTGTESADFAVTEFSTTPSISATQEATTVPTAYWAFNEGYGQAVFDSSNNKFNGTLGPDSSATTADPAWQTNDLCTAGTCLLFDGSNDYVKVASTIYNIQSVSFWVKPKTTGETFIDFDGGTHFIGSSAGTITTSGFTNPTVYVNGKVSSTITANTWQHIEITTATSFNATNITLGKHSASYFTGFMDEVIFYPYVRSSSQVKADYNSGFSGAGTAKGVSTGFGKSAQTWQSNGLLAYWKMDDISATTTDSSGNGITLTNNGAAPTALFSDDFESGGFTNWTGTDQVGTGAVTEVIAGAADTGTRGAHFKTNASTGGYADALKTFSFPAGNKIYFKGRFKPNTVGTGGTILFLSFYKGAPTYQYIANFGYDSTIANWGLFIYRKNGSQDTATLSTLPTIGSWNTIKMAIDESGTNPIYTVWVNGTQAATYTDTTAGTKYSPPHLYIQSYENVWSAAGDVYWDNVALYDSDPDIGSGVTSTSGKYSSSGSYDGTSGFLNTATTVSGIKTVSLWVNPASNTNNYINLTSSARITSSSGVLSATGFSGNTKIYVNGVQNGTITANTWQLITITTDSAINADAFELGRANGSYYTSGSKIDDVRLYNRVLSADEIKLLYNWTPVALQAGLMSGETSPLIAPVLKWEFDESYGTTVHNTGSSAPSQNGLLSTASWTISGKYGSGWTGAGTNWVSTADSNALDFDTGTSFTISAWAKHASSAATEYLVAKYDGTNGGYKIYLKNHTYCLGIDDDNSWGPDDEICTTATFDDNLWHQITAVKTGSTKIELYVDGVSRGSKTPITATSTLANTGTFYVGDQDGSDNGSEFIGSVDEVRVYRYAMSDAQVQVNYNNTSALTWGAVSDTSGVAGGVAGDNSASAAFCIPGDTNTCTAPIAYYKLDEGQGTSAKDSSGNDKNGTIQNGNPPYKWQTGILGKSLEFDGTSQEIDLPLTTQTLIANNSYTWEAWVKPNVPYSLAEVLSACSTNCNQIFSIALDTSNLQVIWGAQGGTRLECPSSTFSFVPNEWAYISVVYNGSVSQANRFSIYINGQDYTNNPGCTSSGTISDITIDRMGIGINSGYAGNAFGTIDEVRVYGYARTFAQITWDYNKGAPVAKYDFDECNGDTVHDTAVKPDPLMRGLNGTIVPNTGRTAGTCGSGTSTEMWNGGTTGKFNASLAFDGSGDYVSIPDATPLNPKNVTVSAWVKTSTTGGYVIAKDPPSTSQTKTATYTPDLSQINEKQNGTNNIAQEDAPQYRKNNYSFVYNLPFFIAGLLGLTAIFMLLLRKSIFKKPLNLFTSIIKSIEQDHTSAFLWIVTFISITLLRDFFENYFEWPVSVISVNTHIEFTLFWVSLFVSLTVFMAIVSKNKITTIFKLTTVAWLVTFIAPIFDRLYYAGQTFTMGYVQFNALPNYLTFFSYCVRGVEATMGIRVEILIVTIWSGAYILIKTKNVIKSALVSLGVYTIIFTHMAFPDIYEVIRSFLPTIKPLNYPNDVSVAFGIWLALLTPVYFVLLKKAGVALRLNLKWISILKIVKAFRTQNYRNDIKVLVKNIRTTRSLHYMLLVAIGVVSGLYYKQNATLTFTNLIDMLLLFLSIFFAWLFAVGINDIFDFNIDKISNTDRPLIKGNISLTAYKGYTVLFGIVSLVLAALASYESINIVLYFLIAYSFLYSAPPLRLRKYFMIPNIIIGICSVFALLLGASVVGGNTVFMLIPQTQVFFIFVVFTLASMLKDLKDYQGDLAEGITTLPTLVGLKNAKIVVAVIIASIVMVSPFFIAGPTDWIITGIAALIALYLVIKTNEKYVFGFWFVYAAFLIINSGVLFKQPEIPLFISAVKNGGYSYYGKTANFEVLFKENSLSNETVKFKAKGSSISYTFMDIGTKKIDPTTAINKDNTLTYPVTAGTSIKYTLNKDLLLEEYIFDQLPEVDKLSKKITLENAYLREQPDGSIKFFGKDAPTELWTIPHPYMYELNNKQNKSLDLHYEITQDGDTFIITKVIDAQGLEWLKKAQYPVVIDDTTVYNPSSGVNTTTVGGAGYCTITGGTTAPNYAGITISGGTDISNPMLISYTAIQTDDAITGYHETPNYNCGRFYFPQYGYIKTKYVISETPSTISQLAFTYKGMCTGYTYSSSYCQIHFFVWNYNTSLWEIIGEPISQLTEGTSTITLNSNIQSYINGSGNLYFLAFGNGYLSPDNQADTRKIYAQYEQLQVTYDAGKTNVPYALSTVSGGQFLIKSGSNTYTATSSVSVADGNWHLLTGTYDGTTMKIYVDGKLTGSGTGYSGDLPTMAGNVRIGADYEATPGNFFTGQIDDVRIYNYALTPAQIGNIKNANAAVQFGQ